MSESVEIPVRVANLEQAIVEIQRLGNEAKKVGQEQKKELSEVGKLMKKALGAQFVAQEMNKLGTILGGTAKQALGVAGAIAQGFGQAGPVGAAIGGGVALFGAYRESIEQAKKEAAAAAAVEREYAEAIRNSSGQIATQLRLRQLQSDILAQGASADELASALASATAAERVLDLQREFDRLEGKSRAALSAYEARVKGLGGEDMIPRLAVSIQKEVAGLNKTYEDLYNERIAVSRKLNIALKTQDAERIKEQILDTQAIAKADEDAAKKRADVARRLAEERKRAEEDAARFVFQRQNEIILAERAAAEKRAAAHEKLLRTREDREDAARGREVERVREWEVERAEIERDGALSRQAARRSLEEAFEAAERTRREAERQRLADIEDAPIKALASSMQSLTRATVSAGIAAVSSGESMGEAMQAATAASLEAVAIESSVQALFSAAKGIGSSVLDPVGAGKHFVAAAQYAATAAAAGAGAALLGGSASTPAAGASGGAGATATGPQQPAPRETRESTIIINAGSGLFMTSDQVNRAVRTALDTHDRRR